MSSFQFLLDENVDPDLRKALKRHVPEMVIWRVGDPGAPALHTLDPDILLWCETSGFSLVTYNRRSMPVHLSDHLATGRHVPGIFILAADMTMGQVINELELLWGAADPTEFTDQILFLPLSE
jgi:hypothetical protein